MTARLMSLLVGLVVALPAAAQQGPVTFFMEEMLFHPRADGVSLALQPAESAELWVEYGPPGGLVLSTAPRQARAGELAVFELDGLWPDLDFSYRVWVRRPHEPDFRPRETHATRTARSPGATVKFAVAADTHAFALWSDLQCGSAPLQPWLTLVNTLERIRADDSLDFVVTGSDSVMTRCGTGCAPCEVDGLPTAEGSAAGPQDARLRYRQVFGPEIYGLLGPERPLLNVLGDHDGEQGWAGSCSLEPDMARWSQDARDAHVPPIPAAYGGDPDGRFYALRSGDVLLVVLDVLSKTVAPLDTPESYTLGARQLDWFERTLAESDATFKIVLAEHLLGGVSSPTANCWKGRGGIRSTTDGLPTSGFLGEQALVHEIMKTHGAQLFLSFHDHVVAVGEKPDAFGQGEGVVYALGGRAGGVGNGWANQDWYRAAMDYDLDGVPEYDTGLTGTRSAGWFEVTAFGGERLRLEYRRSSAALGAEANVLVEFEIAPGGGLLSVGGLPVR